MPQCRMLLEQAGDIEGASTLYTFQNEAIEAVTSLARDLKRWGDSVRAVGTDVDDDVGVREGEGRGANSARRDDASAKQALAQARGAAISAGWPASVITAALATHSATDHAVEAAVARIRETLGPLLRDLVATRNFEALEGMLGVGWADDGRGVVRKLVSGGGGKSGGGGGCGGGGGGGSTDGSAADGSPPPPPGSFTTSTLASGAMITDTSPPIGSFDEASPALRDHVLTTYLPKKLCNYAGVTYDSQYGDDEVGDEDGDGGGGGEGGEDGGQPASVEVVVPNDHGPSEGKLKGMWEQFADPKGKGRKNKGKVTWIVPVQLYTTSTPHHTIAPSHYRPSSEGRRSGSTRGPPAPSKGRPHRPLWLTGLGQLGGAVRCE